MYREIITVKPECQYNGQGCKADDNYPVNMFDTDQGPGLGNCSDSGNAAAKCCPDLVPSGKCLDQLSFCPLTIEYKGENHEG